MTPTTFVSTLGAFVFGTLLAGESGAHSIWFAQRAEKIALIYGVGAADLDTLALKDSFRHVAAYDAEYQPLRAALRVDGPLLLVDTATKPALVSVEMDNGTWSEMPDGKWQKGGRDELPGAKVAEKTLKYAVSVQGALSRPIPPLKGQTLQIVPIGPIPQKSGTALTYRVLFNGKPVAGASLIADVVNDPDAPPVKTNAEGTATLTVRNQGLNTVSAEYIGPTDDATKADHIYHTCTLTFTLANSESS